MTNLSSIEMRPEFEATTNLKNHEGAPAFKRDLAERIVQVLTTNTLGNTFYVKKEELTAETLEVLHEGVQVMPEFLARAIVYARNRAMLKTVPVIASVVLSTAKDKTLLSRVFDRTVLIPDDLRTYVQWCMSEKIKGVKGFGGCRVEPVRSWLNNMSGYHAVKYGSTQSKDITLRDIIRLSHPKPKSFEVSERFGYLCRGWSQIGNSPSPSNPIIWALEKLKRTTDEGEIIRLITAYNLPYEVVVPSVKSMSTKLWEALLKVAPYMNLLRSLKTFERNGVFEKEENLEYAVNRLTDLKELQKAKKLLPFRYLKAFNAWTQDYGFKSVISDALDFGLNQSFVNMPDFPKGSRIAVCPDVSASMNGAMDGSTPWMTNSKRDPNIMRYIDIAGIFASAVLKKSENTILLPFDTKLHSIPYCSRDTMMSIAKRITEFGGGGTSVGLPIQHLLDRKIKVDAMVGITDNVDWAYGYGTSYSCRDGFLATWRNYRKQVNPEAKAFLVTIAPYATSCVPKDEPGVYSIFGWSDAVVGYVPLMLSGGASQLDEIRAIPL